MRKKIPITVMLPPETVERLEKQAKNDLRTRSGYASKLVIQGVENASKPVGIKEMKAELSENANASPPPGTT